MADHHNPGTPSLTYYPAFCHKVSPTFFAWVKMAAVDVHRLKSRPGFEGQNLYFYLNHPIQFICVAGIIVARDEQERRSILVVDDSSGACLEVVCSKTVPVSTYGCSSRTSISPSIDMTTATTSSNVTGDCNSLHSIPIPPTHQTSTTHKPINITPLLPGARAKLKGTIACFRGMFQLHLERYEMLRDTNAEVRFWDERTRLRVQVLSVPWVVGQGEVERLRREAEKGDAGRGGGKVRGRDRCGDGDMNRDGHVIARRKKMEMEKKWEKRRMEREEKDKLRILKRYMEEDVVREKFAKRCREMSVLRVDSEVMRRVGKEKGDNE
ncbi:hypothetical protein PABG_05292 [Paracoccidioides brasiliensis Pb03]|nr:hypothetical protein PABG_05292 [Paracoccidioides brasiliensis Pb03]